MDEVATGKKSELERLQKRLDRERRARMEAEAIAEKALRELYDKQQALVKEMTERKRLERQYLQAQRMEAVGRLAGGVAHDFNNLLTAIIGYSDMICGSLPNGDRTRERVEMINKAGKRAAALTRQLLAFSRKQVFDPVLLDLNARVTDLEHMLRRLIGEDVALTIALDPSLVPVKADPSQLEQVIMNLVVNARDAMPQGGKLIIETASVHLDQSFAQRQPEVQPGFYAMLAVTDTGHGMDEDIKTHIFEPFFTTKEPGKGTGLGLATVYGIVKQSGGYIYVQSEPGRGTTFRIYLPKGGEGQPLGVHPAQATESSDGAETILVVEDEEVVRSFARLVLQDKGYTVLAACDGQEALAICEQHRGPIHLMVTDVIMPGMNGRQLSNYVTSLRPTLRVLFVSGYTDNAIAHHGVLDRGTDFLPKPYAPDTLARKVREVLDR